MKLHLLSVVNTVGSSRVRSFSYDLIQARVKTWKCLFLRIISELHRSLMDYKCQVSPRGSRNRNRLSIRIQRQTSWGSSRINSSISSIRSSIKISSHRTHMHVTYNWFLILQWGTLKIISIATKHCYVFHVTFEAKYQKM